MERRRRLRDFRDAFARLHYLLTGLILRAGPTGLAREQAEEMMELLPLYPMAEVLAGQGGLMPWQRETLHTVLKGMNSRYSFTRFKDAALRRDPEYLARTALEESRYGRIWGTLFELICRVCQPGSLQQVNDSLCAITRSFAAMDGTEDVTAEALCGHLGRCLNRHFVAYRESPPIRALTLLQRLLTEKCGVKTEEQVLIFAKDLDIDGAPYTALIAARGREEPELIGRFAVGRGPGTLIYWWRGDAQERGKFYREGE